MSTTLGVKVDDDLRERLKMLAELKDRSTHWIIKKAIEQYLAREEAAERERREDRERWERYQLTGAAVPNDQAIDWLLVLPGCAAGLRAGAVAPCARLFRTSHSRPSHRLAGEAPVGTTETISALL